MREEHILSDNKANWNLPYSKYHRYFKVKVTPRKTSKGMKEICTTLCTMDSIPFIKQVLDKKKDLQIKQA
jgi:phage antirepressor YoqD-like protein